MRTFRPFRLSSLALLALLAVSPHGSAAPLDEARTKGLAWLIQNQHGDGAWRSNANGLEAQASANAIEAFRRGGLRHAPQFGTALAWLANIEADSTDTLARKGDVLATAGMPAVAQGVADHLYTRRVATNAAVWGGYPGHSMTFIDTALGLTALRVADAGYDLKAAQPGSPLLGALCQLATGRITPASGQAAWPVARAASGQSASTGRPSVATTSLVLSELHAMHARLGWGGITCDGNTHTISTLLQQASAWLLAQQNADGGFGETRTDGSAGPSNLIVSALAYKALAGQSTPPQPATTNALSYLLAQQDHGSGSWRGDALVTAQVLAVLPAANGDQLTDSDLDGLPDVVEALLGTNPLVADAGITLPSPDLSQPGITASAFTATGVIGQPFSHALGALSDLVLISGALPPGIDLDPTTATLAGTPGQSGRYAFEFASDGGNGSYLIGRIDIAAALPHAVDEDGDIPLPAWALALLGVAMLHALRRQPRA